jgi:hypothetical protein
VIREEPAVRNRVIPSSLAALALLFLLSGASPQPPASPRPPAPPPPKPTPGSTSNCVAPPAINYKTPGDIALTRQADANCFAWQEFISLGWRASAAMRGQPDTTVPASRFGVPLDDKAVVWETYKESDEVFLPGAKDPGPWNAWPGGRVKNLGGMLSEVDPDPPLDLTDVGQASPGHPWLTTQSRIITLYDRRMNQDEYDYIVKNKLYDASVQQTFVVNPGINLPDNTQSPLGSIETKAAWIELPNKADWPRFKIARATVCYPKAYGQPCSIVRKNVVVGLVGLHIIHKTALGQQLIWATFEHRGNCPDATEVASGKLAAKYTYYNPKCDPKTDYYQCQANANPVNYKGKQSPNPFDAPIQVVRTTPIASRPNDDVAGLNQYAWAQIRAANPKSVYLNYQLVNALWSNQNTAIPAGARIPLIAAELSPGPSQEPVSNTTLETYVQSLTCLDCHASAPIASVTPPATTKILKLGSPSVPQNPYASDYSFLFNNAQPPKANKGNH